MRNPIRPLPDLLISQIAAGEVVERPASVLKELLENALDAGSTALRIDLEEGGVALIRVTDDGGGIPKDELPLALTRHATSKIANLLDLERVATLGFRGEALASVAAVSRLTLTSRERSAPHAWKLTDAAGEAEPAALLAGTVVEMRDLYYNTPARRKFLKAAATEAAHCLEAVKRVALSHADVAFTVTRDGREILRLARGEPKQRIADLLGAAFLTESVEVDADAGALRVTGLALRPTAVDGTKEVQYCFVNGRYVRDKLLQHALREAYRDILHGSRQPSWCVFLDIDPAAVDVNVHPAKTEVRFRDSRAVHQFVFHALRQALATPIAQAAVQAAAQGGAAYAPRPPVAPAVPAAPAPQQGALGIREPAPPAYVPRPAGTVGQPSGQTPRQDWASRPTPAQAASYLAFVHAAQETRVDIGASGLSTEALYVSAEEGTDAAQASARGEARPDAASAALAAVPPAGRAGEGEAGSVAAASPLPADGPSALATAGGEGMANLAAAALAGAPRAGGAASASMPAAADNAPPPLGYAMAQLQDMFILAQNAQGLVIVDQHAAHERVLYEELKAAFDGRQVASQPLLIPVVVRADPLLVAAAEEHQEELAGFGFELSPAGPGEVAVRAVPVLLGRANPAELVRAVLDALGQAGDHGAGRELEAWRNELLATCACHGAVRGRRPMTVPEMNALLRRMEATERAGSCNHGRPTWVQLTTEQVGAFFLHGR
ncbi:putative DNA mismatch repair protein [Oryzomicrobium terrae]|uniref:DNA mismatch repair protein MutL n=1 Tax=Oryzomicrobium terrae TaxID=1735038 RepID=A0A5C1EC32_9RHOO|nr:DNA mismatch repair endonuclease MutL [Oryzomicrobium terrae]QEL65828.1 putative DNA mismatch repair protein [Oryzomicrobium terrae]